MAMGSARRRAEKAALRPVVQSVPELQNTVPTVPPGTTREVLAWVGDDPERAELALADELAAAEPRPRLIEALRAVGEE